VDEFDQLFFRFSNTTNTADVIDFHSFTIEHVVPEPRRWLCWDWAACWRFGESKKKDLLTGL